MSGLARLTGVSAAAPYRHFADRDAVYDAISDEGYLVFEEGLRAAVGRESEPGAALVAAGRAYLSFAADYAPYFAVMFRDRDGRPHEVGPRSFAVFSAAVVAARDAGRLDGGLSAEAWARVLWSGLHGAAVLTASGGFAKLGLDVPSEQMVDELLRPLLRTPA